MLIASDSPDYGHHIYILICLGKIKTSKNLNYLLSFSHSPIGPFSIIVFSTVHTVHKLSVLSSLVLSAGEDSYNMQNVHCPITIKCQHKR